VVKQKWLLVIGLILNVVSISILLLLRFSAPDMGVKYYNELTISGQQVFWVAGILLLVAIMCKAVYWGKEWVRNK